MSAPGPRFEHVGLFVHEEIQPAARSTGTENLVMWITDAREAELPDLRGLRRKALRFTRHADDCVTGIANRIGHSGRFIASQLEATRRSPEPAIEDNHDESVLCQLIVEPAPPHTDRRVEMRGDHAVIGFDRANLEPPTLRLDTNLFAETLIAIAQDQTQLDRLARIPVQRPVGIH